MTACKENRSTGKIVIIDTEKPDLQNLPQNVQTAFGGKGNIWPKIVLTDPAMTKIYGAFSYEELKPQEYRSLFRAARRAFDADADSGALVAPGQAKPEEPAHGKTASGEAGNSGFEPTDYESWQSTAGSAIEARLVAIDGRGRFVFETRDGKKIPVAPSQLQLESRQRAESAAKGTGE